MPTPYDRANQILNDHLPAVGKANEILGTAFPFMAAANRTLADAGLASHGAYLPPRAADLPLPSRTAPRVSGPHRFSGRSPVAKLIAGDVAGGTVVDINAWAGNLSAAGVPGETIREAYEAAGGSTVLAAAERTATSSDDGSFAAAFTDALVELGVPAKVVVGAYQQAGGTLGGSGSSGSGGPAGGAGGGSGGGFLGDAARGAERAAAGAEHFAQETVNQMKKLFGL